MPASYTVHHYMCMGTRSLAFRCTRAPCCLYNRLRRASLAPCQGLVLLCMHASLPRPIPALGGGDEEVPCVHAAARGQQRLSGREACTQHRQLAYKLLAEREAELTLP